MTYIGWIVIDPGIEAKIKRRHNVTAAEVREAVLHPARAQAFWEEHPEHGRRLIVKGTSWAGRVILAWLEPVDETDGTWALRSARGGI